MEKGLYKHTDILSEAVQEYYVSKVGKYLWKYA